MRPLPPTRIATDRLDLVPLRVADADEMVAVLGDPALYAFIGGEPPTHAGLVARYEAQVRGHSADGREVWHNWIVRERLSGDATGFVQASIVDAADGAGRAAAEIAWVIGVPWQGRGYASEAARGVVAWLLGAEVGSIVAHVRPDHAASTVVAERAGFAPTDRFVDGEREWERRASAAG